MSGGTSRRKPNDDKIRPGANLSGCDLAGRDLAGRDLRGANIEDANLSGTIGY